MRSRSCTGLIITHTGHILDYVNARTGYIMLDGQIGCVGDPHEILATIKERGYEECVRCVLRGALDDRGQIIPKLQRES